MRFSLRLNNDLPVAEYPRLARRAEEVGFDQFWVSHDLFLRHAWVVLSAVAQATSRIGLGTCVANPYTQHPSDLAMAAATLDELSGGRFALGLASGARDFLGWVGITPERPVAAVAESVAALRRLFAGGRGLPDGAFLRGWSDEAYLRVPTRPIPVYLGATSPRMVRLIGEVADGGLPLALPPEHFAEVAAEVRAGAARAGRDPAAVDLAACIWCSVSEDRAAAEQALRDKVAYYGHALGDGILARLGVERAAFEPIRRAVMVDRDPDRARALVTPEMLRVGVVGTAEDLVPRLEWLVAHGARHLSFGPPLGPDPFEAIGVLGRDILPRFRDC